MNKKLIDKVANYHMAVRHRKYRKNFGGGIQFIPLHNTCHRILLPGIRLLRKLRGQKLIVVGDKRAKESSKAIYACTHIGDYDVENLFEAIISPCYLFMDDPREMYLNFDGILLRLNGVIWFEKSNKLDRKIAKERAISLLKTGGSLMIFPEGAYNVYESLPVMPLFWGTADMAIQSRTPIVPIAIEKYEKNFYVNVGKTIEVDTFSDMDRSSLTELLQDELATLKWEIWEKQGSYKRAELSDSRESFLSSVFCDKNRSYTVEDAVRNRFYPKSLQ